MTDERWIVIPNWGKFQHYKDRVPPWIKLQLEILDKPETDALTDAQLGLLVRVWALYARTRGALTVQKVQSYTRSSHTPRKLEALNHAGLIEFSASKPQALRALANLPGKSERRIGGNSTQQEKPNAAAYHEYEADNGTGDYVSLEQLQAYAAALDNRRADA
jgi:hypothetical protein